MIKCNTVICGGRYGLKPALRTERATVSTIDIGRRMVRELELFLSYALRVDADRRWVGLVRSTPVAR